MWLLPPTLVEGGGAGFAAGLEDVRRALIDAPPPWHALRTRGGKTSRSPGVSLVPPSSLLPLSSFPAAFPLECLAMDRWTSGLARLSRPRRRSAFRCRVAGLPTHRIGRLARRLRRERRRLGLGLRAADGSGSAGRRDAQPQNGCPTFGRSLVHDDLRNDGRHASRDDGGTTRDFAYVDYHQSNDRLLAFAYELDATERAGQLGVVDVFAVLRKSGRSYWNRQRVYLGTATFQALTASRLA